jgi:SAM-dependent methyltransferase
MNIQEHEKLAAVEDQSWYFRSLHAHFERALRQALPAGKPARIVDAGCGTGGLLRRLQPRNPDWSLQGLDISPEACALARQRTGAEIRQASVLQMPWESGSLDAILSADLLCQLEDPAAALAECHRSLRPGGLLLLNLPACSSLFSYHDLAVGNLHRYSAGELRALLAKAGFRGVQLTHWNTLLFPAVYVRRKFFPPKDQASDVKALPTAGEWCLRSVMGAEHAWLELGFGLPFGLSLFAVARKPLVDDCI